MRPVCGWHEEQLGVRPESPRREDRCVVLWVDPEPTRLVRAAWRAREATHPTRTVARARARGRAGRIPPRWRVVVEAEQSQIARDVRPAAAVVRRHVVENQVLLDAGRSPRRRDVDVQKASNKVDVFLQVAEAERAGDMPVRTIIAGTLWKNATQIPAPAMIARLTGECRRRRQ